MENTTGIWRFATPIRWLALLVLILFGVYTVASVGSTLLVGFTGSYHLIYEFARVEGDAPVAYWKLPFFLIAYIVLFYGVYKTVTAANRFIKMTQKNGFFIEGVSRLCTDTGIGLIIFWAGTTYRRNVLPYFLDPDRGIWDGPTLLLFGWINVHLILMLLAGVIFLLLGRGLEAARDIKEENKQFI